MIESPLPMMWTEDEVFRVLPRFQKEAVRRYCIGETYLMAEQADRNMAAHRGYFAGIKDAWDNLPEEWGDYFKSPEHLRKWCLIKTGYCNQVTYNFANHLEAMRFARDLRQGDQEFRLVEVSGPVATIYTAESQQVLRKGKGMDNARFMQSKRDVQAWLDGMLGMKEGTLRKREKDRAPAAA